MARKQSHPYLRWQFPQGWTQATLTAVYRELGKDDTDSELSTYQQAKEYIYNMLDARFAEWASEEPIVTAINNIADRIRKQELAGIMPIARALKKSGVTPDSAASDGHVDAVVEALQELYNAEDSDEETNVA